ncbi:hypothetical protein [Pseudomaricurvus sp. HS19]|uniref:hypothetical protein n=1 Tax=Pseudomaricurvus sp. HS19 TaxID=2692626 RepID=UPI00136D2562|nr:hypothetical protein [Pseudomaricurvus sp. HS19]MYM62057.1 hypothetical protein [Pseudomaricurvus sp. HS19]
MNIETFLSVDQLLQPWQFSALNGSQMALLATVTVLLLLALVLVVGRGQARLDTGVSGPLAEQYRQQMTRALAEGVQLSHEDQALVLAEAEVTAEPIHFSTGVVAQELPEETGKPRLELVGGSDHNRPRASDDELMQGIRRKTRDYIPPACIAGGYIVEEMAAAEGLEKYAVSHS